MTNSPTLDPADVRKDTRRKVTEDIFDEKGKQILIGDLLQVYHFTGARRKKYFMYKTVINIDGYWCAKEYDAHDGSFYTLQFNEKSILIGATILNEKDWETKRKRINAAQLAEAVKGGGE